MALENFNPQRVETFGGRYTLDERSECPPGMSPNASDVVFTRNAVKSRPGLGLRYTDTSCIDSIKSLYGVDAVRRLVLLKADGGLLVESPEGICNQLETGMGVGMQMQATYAFNRLWMCFSDGKRPLDYPWQFDSTAAGDYPNGPVFGASPPSPTGDAIVVADGAAGSVAAGFRRFFITYEDKYGFVTGGSATFTYTAGGGAKASFTNLPIPPQFTTSRARGPFSYKRRIWATVAGGAGSYYSPSSFIINTNVTSFVLDFTDATLQTGILWDSSMTQIPIPPAIGAVSYNSRLAFYGIFPSVPNQLVLFEPGVGGGVTQASFGPPSIDFSNEQAFPAIAVNVPSWTGSATAALNALVSVTGTRTGSALEISGNGVGSGSVQMVFANWRTPGPGGDGISYLTPGDAYGLMARIRKVGTTWTAGTLLLKLSEASPSVLCTRTLANTDVTTDWALYPVPSNVPLVNADTILTIDVLAAGLNNGARIQVDWVLVRADRNKFDGSTLWWSQFNSPSTVDLLAGQQPIHPGDGEEIRYVFEQSGNVYIVKERSTWSTTDNGQDPTTWPVENVSPIVGTPSIHGGAKGPDFAVIASRDGAYYINSGRLEKISQEIQPDWDAIDWTQGHLIHVIIDPRLKEVRISVPTMSVTGACSQVFVCNYLEGWAEGTAYNHGSNARRWSIDYIVSNCSEMAEKDDLTSRVVYGGQRAATNRVLVAPTAFTQLGAALPAIPVQDATVASPVGVASAASKVYKAHYTGAGGTARLQDVEAVVLGEVPIGSYVIISGWLKLASGTKAATFISPHPSVSAVDYPFTITSAWQRVVHVFGPTTAGGVDHLNWDLDFGTVPLNFRCEIYGAQIQISQYDQGYPGVGTTGYAGFLSTPITGLAGQPGWQTSDWDAVISPIYEFAPFTDASGLKRSNYDRFVARIRGVGDLMAYWIPPDNTPVAFQDGTFKPMSPTPTEDMEYGGNQQGPFMGVRLMTSGITNWFVLKRFGLFSKEHESSPLRSR